MKGNHFNISPLMPLIERGEIILTANNRLRNYVLRAYANHHVGGMVVKKPNVYSFSEWIGNRWKQFQENHFFSTQLHVVDGAQRLALWEDVIRKSEISSGLLQPEALASSADSAHRNLELWDVMGEYLDYASGLAKDSDSYYFSECIVSFEKMLDNRSLLTSEKLLKLMTVKAIDSGDGKELPVINLLGFDDVPPLHSKYLHAVSSACNIITLPSVNSSLHRVECLNQEDEVRSAAIWSKRQLESSPDALIGVIVTNLGQCRDMVERVFTDVFEPQSSLPENARYTMPFNFSAGTPLGSTPIIVSTLDILEMAKREINLDTACSIVLSPFFGDAKNEQTLRTHLVDALRGLGKFNITITDMRTTCAKVSEKLKIDPDTNRLLKSFLLIENMRHEVSGNHSAEYWSGYFNNHLKVFGWPGTRRLDSQEHQQLVLWNTALESLMQLDAIGKKMSFGSALRSLRNIANKLPFQPKTPHSPIQILGALEGGGLQFSHCWVLGLDHRQWPPAPSPNPLIPMSFQRDYKMPHSSAERELVFAKGLTAHYSSCAPVTVLSSARADKEQSLSPSPLIRSLSTVSLASLIGVGKTTFESNADTIGSGYDGSSLELVDTSNAPKFNVEKEHVRGGAGIFKEQGACPFNAFAKLRLGAIAPEVPVPGFSPVERGNMLHEVLASVWKVLKKQSSLIDTHPDSLRDMVKKFAQIAVDRVHLRHREIGSYYAILEKNRIERLSLQWLEQEKYRPAFEVISIEDEVKVTFADLPLRLRLDRIDRLENGDLLLIDYKTGNPNVSSWDGERLDEPQLPLYAVIGESQVNAIAFAQINAKGMKWIGKGELQIDHDGIKSCDLPWSQQVDEWRSVLTNLAKSFMDGDVRVDMKNAITVRYNKELEPLNRLPDAAAISNLMQTLTTFIGNDEPVF